MLEGVRCLRGYGAADCNSLGRIPKWVTGGLVFCLHWLPQ